MLVRGASQVLYEARFRFQRSLRRRSTLRTSARAGFAPARPSPIRLITPPRPSCSACSAWRRAPSPALPPTTGEPIPCDLEPAHWSDYAAGAAGGRWCRSALPLMSSVPRSCHLNRARDQPPGVPATRTVPGWAVCSMRAAMLMASPSASVLGAHVGSRLAHEHQPGVDADALPAGGSPSGAEPERSPRSPERSPDRPARPVAGRLHAQSVRRKGQNAVAHQPFHRTPVAIDRRDHVFERC